MDNPTSISYRNGTQTITEYSAYGMTAVTAGTDKKEYSYDKLGRMVTSRQYAGEVLTDETNYTYDAFGRKIGERNGEDILKEYSYDGNSNLLSYTLKEYEAEKSTSTYSYNNLNRLTEMNADGIISTYGYDANGNLTSKTTGAIETVYTYNGANLPVSMVNRSGDKVYNEYSYGYSLDGNRISERETGGESKEYTYDGLGRLTVEKAGEEETAYTYDAYGNRIKMTVTGEESFTTDYVYDMNNRLLKERKRTGGAEEITDYEYDPNGNRISWRKSMIKPKDGVSESVSAETDGTGFAVYGYDGFNRLSTYTNGITKANYGYNAENLRIYKVVDGNYRGFVWDGGNLIAETNDNVVTNTYSY